MITNFHGVDYTHTPVGIDEAIAYFEAADGGSFLPTLRAARDICAGHIEGDAWRALPASLITALAADIVCARPKDLPPSPSTPS